MIHWKSLLKEALSTVLIAALIATVIKIFIVDNRIVPSSSMYPTIYVGDMLLVNKTAYYFNDPQRGDIVVFKPEKEIGQKDLVKRVIGLPGETVVVQENKVFIDKKALNEDYLDEPPQYDFGPVKVPSDCLFVLGDNRNMSYDSHQWSNPFISIKSVKGKVFFRYWPLDRMGRMKEVRYENPSDQ